MTTRESWEWAGDLVRFEPETSGDEVWLNPRLPDLDHRARHPLRVEILCFFLASGELEDALGRIQRFFEIDSMLAAVERQDTAWRFVVYTSADEPTAHRRYREMRETWKPPVLGLRTRVEPGWESLVVHHVGSDQMDGDAAVRTGARR